MRYTFFYQPKIEEAVTEILILKILGFYNLQLRPGLNDTNFMATTAFEAL